MKVKSVLFFSNGNTIIFDESGQSISDYQKWGWFEAYIHYLKDQGADLDGCRFTMPDGKQAKIMKLEDGKGFNWEIFKRVDDGN